MFGAWDNFPGLESDHKVDESCWPITLEVLEELLPKDGAQKAEESRVHAYVYRHRLVRFIKRQTYPLS